MKKLFTGLPFRLLAGVVTGILAGWLAGHGACRGGGNRMDECCCDCEVYPVGTDQFLCAFDHHRIYRAVDHQTGTNCVKNAGDRAAVRLCVHDPGSRPFHAAGYGIIPRLSVVSEAEGLRELPEVVFQLEIPAVMSVMSALVLSVLLGLACTWTKAVVMTELLEEFQKIVLEIVTRVVIPVLPAFIGFTFCALSYEGMITKQLPVFLKVILIVILGHYLWLAVLYIAAGIYFGTNPLTW